MRPATRRVALCAAVAGVFVVNVACHVGNTVDIIDNRFVPANVELVPTANLFWENEGAETHTSTSDDGFWDSGDIAPAGTYDRDFHNSGTFTYHCNNHPKMKGKASVPTTASDPQVAVGGSVTIFWAFFDPFDEPGPPSIPAGTDADVQVRKPGSKKWKIWLEDQTTSQTSGSYTPTKKGKYRFRARLQDSTTGDASGWSPDAVVQAT